MHLNGVVIAKAHGRMDVVANREGLRARHHDIGSITNQSPTARLQSATPLALRLRQLDPWATHTLTRPLPHMRLLTSVKLEQKILIVKLTLF